MFFLFRMLIKIYPELADIAMQKCVTEVSEGMSYEMNYEFLDDAFYHEQNENSHDDDDAGEITNNGNDSFKYSKIQNGAPIKNDDPYHANPATLMRNHPLLLISRNDRAKSLLKNPLCLALVSITYRHIANSNT